MLVIVAVVLVAAAVHLERSYLPRERPGRVDPDSPSGRLLSSDDLPFRLWVAYPHQNVGAFAAGIDDPEAWFAAAARLLGSTSSTVPRFGPFRLPPARALAVASDSSGERGVVAVDVYPTLAVVARLAGRVAGNPVLAGGRVEIDGEPVEVEWQGSTWLLRRGLPGELSGGSAVPDRPVLAWLSLDRASEPLPAGRYALAREEAALVFSSAEPRSVDVPAVRLEESLAAAGLDDVAFLGARDASESLSVLLLLGGMPFEEGVLRLPDAAALFLDESNRHSLPGESLAKALDLDLRRAQAGPYGIVASTDRALEAARLLEPHLQDWLAGEVDGVVWVRPSVVGPLVSVTRRVLESVPIFGRREARRWRDLSIVLTPLLERETVVLETGTDGSARLVL